MKSLDGIKTNFAANTAPPGQMKTTTYLDEISIAGHPSKTCFAESAVSEAWMRLQPTKLFTAPDCPKCGGASIAPTRAGMSATPYKCTSCNHAFSLISPRLVSPS